MDRGGHVSAGQLDELAIAGAVVLLVLLLAIRRIKGGRALDEAPPALRAARERSEPLFTGANTTLDHVNTQLERVDGITANARAVTGNVSALTSLFTATLGGPLVRVAALSYGVSKAMRSRRKSSKDVASGGRPGGRRNGGRG